MSRNIVPRIDKGADLGTAEKNWNKLYADAVILRGSDLRALLDSKIDLSTAIAKGDLFVATGAGMITRFPRGADGEVLVSNSQTEEGLDWVPAGARQELTSDITINVGTGGDFPTINDALAYCVSMYYPTFLATGSVPKVTINLLSGFVMSEQVIVDYLNLSWITIVGVDPETTIRREALTIPFTNAIPAFSSRNGGFLPIIGQLFNMDNSGSEWGKTGIHAYRNSKAIISSGCGVKNSSGYDIRATYSSTIEASGIGAEGTRIYADTHSTINASNANIPGGYVCALNGSIINAYQANVSGENIHAQCSIHAQYGSAIQAQGANVSGGSRYGIVSSDGSIVNAQTADVSATSETRDHGIFAYNGSIVNAQNADASEARLYGIRISSGSIVIASGATGTLIQAANVVTSNGIIIQ